MIFTLDLAGLPAGAAEALLPLEAAKAHLRVLEDDEDDLIEALRDAALVAVENYTGLLLIPRTDAAALTLRGETLPIQSGVLRLHARPVTELVSLTYRDANNVAQSIDVTTLRITDGDGVVPVPGVEWPTDCAGAVVVTFEAGLAVANVPAQLLVAAKMMLATLYMYRETVTMNGAAVDFSPGFMRMCAPYRRFQV